MNNLVAGIGALIVAGLVLIGLMAVITLPIWLLWNWLIPEVFGGPVMTFWQTMGLWILAKIVIGKVSVSDAKSKLNLKSE